MKYCQKCGTQNEDAVADCTNCGTPFGAQGTDVPIEKAKKKKKKGKK